MKRSKMLEKLSDQFDVTIIGGGATGLGCAVEASSRGYKTLLLEQSDFAKGTSSRSTKLIHGGVRYLQQGNIALVNEALHERSYLNQNAPHLITHRSFLVPNYKWWEGPFYGFGLKIYDALAGKCGFEASKHLSMEETLQKLPTLEPHDLKGSTLYTDGQFDDARLAITLARTCVNHGGNVLNYSQVKNLIKENGVITGVAFRDLINERDYKINSKIVINATGIFSDAIRSLDDQNAKKIIVPSQGIHIVLPKSFLNSDAAILVPHTVDKRVLFFVPWQNSVLLGTTDTHIEDVQLEPKPRESEIDYLLEHAKKYLTKPPKKSDILSVFAGIRPLVNPQGNLKTSSITRDHHIEVSDSNLVTIAGGKWTIYRKMGEDTIDVACDVANLTKTKSVTKTLKLHGYSAPDDKNPLIDYGSMYSQVLKLSDKLLDPDHYYVEGQVLIAIEEEMAMTIEDVLARRMRILFTDANLAWKIAPRVASILQKKLNKSDKWLKNELNSFQNLVRNYLPR